MAEMTSRERVMRALNHRAPDKVPNDLGGTAASCICMGAYRDLVSHLKLNVKKPEIMDRIQQVPFIDEALLTFFEVDFRPLTTNSPSTWRMEIREEGDYYTFVDEWSAKLRMPREKGYYFDYYDFPIKESTLDALKRYKWPNPDDSGRMAQVKEKAEFLYYHTDYAIVGNPIFGGGIFEQPTRVRGMEEFYAELARNRKFADALMERITEIYIQAYENFLDEVGKYIQVIVYWDDLGGQQAPIISPSLYRRLIKPKQKRLFEAIKSKTGAKLFFHSDGAIYEFIPDLIEIGIDILNPVQVSAKGMEDTAKLKREFGKDVVFWGAACDPQKILPFGSPAEVREETKRRLQDLMGKGGFIFAPIHNIQSGVPPQNMVAMYETLRDYGKY